MRLHTVPARTGLHWVRLGVRTFLRQPLAMAGQFFLFMATASVLSLIPVLGLALGLAMVPAATLGLMASTREADAGRFPMPTMLFSAFRAGPERMRAMLVLGAAYAGALLLVMVVAMLLGAGDAAPSAVKGTEVTSEALQAALAGPGMWLVMLLYLPVLAAFWHAPALVHWHGVSPVKSLFFSLLACWANKGAMMVFMLGWVGVFMLAGLLVSLLGGLLGSAEALQAIMFPLVLLLASMFHTSIYFTFRDSFATDDDAPTPEGEPT